MTFDLQSLAALQKPELMPGAATGPFGPGAMAGAEWGRQRNAYESTIQQLTPLANLGNQVNMQADQNTLANQPNIEADRAHKAIELKFQQLTPYARAWSSAADDDAKQSILKEVSKNSGMENLKNLSIEDGDRLMSMVKDAEVNTPQLAQQESIWGKRTASNEKIASGKVGSAQSIQEMKGALALQLQGNKLASDRAMAEFKAKYGPDALKYMMESSLRDLQKNPDDPNALATVQFLSQQRIAERAAGAQVTAAQKDNITGAVLGTPPTPGVTPPPVPAYQRPTPAAAPQPAAVEPAPNLEKFKQSVTQGSIYQTVGPDGKPVQKVVSNVYRNSKGQVKLRFQDGTEEILP